MLYTVFVMCKRAEHKTAQSAVLETGHIHTHIYTHIHFIQGTIINLTTRPKEDNN